MCCIECWEYCKQWSQCARKICSDAILTFLSFSALCAAKCFTSATIKHIHWTNYWLAKKSWSESNDWTLEPREQVMWCGECDEIGYPVAEWWLHQGKNRGGWSAYPAGLWGWCCDLRSLQLVRSSFSNVVPKNDFLVFCPTPVYLVLAVTLWIYQRRPYPGVFGSVALSWCVRYHKHSQNMIHFLRLYYFLDYDSWENTK